MRNAHSATLLSALLVAFFLTPSSTLAQENGKGGGKEHGKSGAHAAPATKGNGSARSHGNAHGNAQGNERGNARAVSPGQAKHAERGTSGRGNAYGNAKDLAKPGKSKGRTNVVFGGEVMRRAPVRYAGSLVATARKHGVPDDAVIYTPLEDRVVLRNHDGLVLLDLDDQRLRDMGGWKVVRLDDDVKSGAPAFCRSGAGHPVWGRQWCIDKGFGLGDDGDFRWGRTVDPRDVVIVRPVSAAEILTRDVLASVLGPTAFDRLAVHAITLGLVEPLVGRWLGDTTGPDVLLVSSGDRAVAEFVDVDRDTRADQLYVLLPSP